RPAVGRHAADDRRERRRHGDLARRAGSFRALRRGRYVLRHRPGRRRVVGPGHGLDRKSTRLNSSHVSISYAVFCLKKKKRYFYNSNSPDRLVLMLCYSLDRSHLARLASLNRNVSPNWLCLSAHLIEYILS